MQRLNVFSWIVNDIFHLHRCLLCDETENVDERLLRRKMCQLCWLAVAGREELSDVSKNAKIRQLTLLFIVIQVLLGLVERANEGDASVIMAGEQLDLKLDLSVWRTSRGVG